MQSATLRIVNETLAKLDHYTVTRGVPMPPGVLQDEKSVTVRDAKGDVLPSEGKVLHRRVDDSVEWILMDILLKLGGDHVNIPFSPHVPGPGVSCEYRNLDGSTVGRVIDLRIVKCEVVITGVCWISGKRLALHIYYGARIINIGNMRGSLLSAYSLICPHSFTNCWTTSFMLAPYSTCISATV